MKPTFKNRPNELITTTDGRKLYHSRSVAVVLTLVCYEISSDTINIAVEKRGDAPGLDKQGLWCLPCGYLDWDEDGADAVRREAWEEIGIDMRELEKKHINGPTLDAPWFVKSKPDENRQNVTLRYGLIFASSKLPVLIPNNDCDHPNEVADAKWIRKSDVLLNTYQFAFNHDKVILDFYGKYI